jgi:hypothetical protein
MDELRERALRLLFSRAAAAGVIENATALELTRSFRSR